MKITGLEEVLMDIHCHSDHLILQHRKQKAPDIVQRRIEQINGMLELVGLLARAEYPIPALLHGFLRYESERVKSPAYLRRLKQVTQDARN